MKLIPLLLLSLSCATASPAIGVQFDRPADFDEKGPFFACLRMTDKREMRCLDMAEFIQAVQRSKRETQGSGGTEL